MYIKNYFFNKSIDIINNFININLKLKILIFIYLYNLLFILKNHFFIISIFYIYNLII